MSKPVKCISLYLKTLGIRNVIVLRSSHAYSFKIGMRGRSISFYLLTYIRMGLRELETIYIYIYIYIYI